MDTNISDLLDTALAETVKENLYFLFRSFDKSSLVNFNQTTQSLRWVTPVAHPWFNGVLSLRKPDANSIQEVHTHAEYFRSHFVEGVTWWVVPQVDVTTWLPILVKEGFIFDDDTPGMAMDLKNLPVVSLPGQLEIRQVMNAEDLWLWTHVFIRGYGLSNDFNLPYYGLMASLGIDLPFRHYIGYLNNKAVAASTLLLGAGSAGIYNVATLPGARGKGIGSAMTLYPLLEARQLGYLVGVLQSSEMGLPVYLRLGFRQVKKMEHFFKRIDDNTPV